MSLKLQVGAILIADAHFSANHPEFSSFLHSLESGKIQTSQLILMGDMFELLFGDIKASHKDNLKEIALINKLSEKIEVIYFEGNHDFRLKKLFPKVTIFKIQNQPQMATFNKQKILLSHGDTQTPLSYQIYTKLIRNPLVLNLVGMFNILCASCLLKWLKSRGERKDSCYKIDLFKDIIKKRLGYLKDEALDIVVEGHFHQNLSFSLHQFEYINLASFACNQKYFIVQSRKEQLILQEIQYKLN